MLNIYSMSNLINFLYVIIKLLFYSNPVSFLLHCDIYGGTQTKIFEMFYGFNIFFTERYGNKTHVLHACTWHDWCSCLRIFCSFPYSSLSRYSLPS